MHVNMLEYVCVWCTGWACAVRCLLVVHSLVLMTAVATYTFAGGGARAWPATAVRSTRRPTGPRTNVAFFLLRFSIPIPKPYFVIASSSVLHPPGSRQGKEEEGGAGTGCAGRC